MVLTFITRFWAHLEIIFIYKVRVQWKLDLWEHLKNKNKLCVSHFLEPNG